MSDYSLAYFSFKGREPTRLPRRFKTRDGETFYSFKCSLSNILKAGFVGPIDKPVVTQNEVAVWSRQTLSYEVREKTDLEKAVQEDKEVRAVIDTILDDAIDIHDPKYTADFVNAATIHYGTLYSLKSQERLISWSDIPDREPYSYELQSTQDAVNKHLRDTASGLIRNYQFQHEYYGQAISDIREASSDFDQYCLCYGDPKWVASGTSIDRIHKWEDYRLKNGFNNDEVQF